MAQTYTLDEAAERLGITPEEMKRRLKEDWKTLRSFRDGPTLRFRASDIEDLARSLGAASDPALPLAPAGEAPGHGSDDFKVTPPKKPAPVDEPLSFDSASGDDDIFSLTADEPALPPQGGKGKGAKGDSDVRLQPPTKAKGEAASVVPTEEISLDFSGPGSAVIKGGSSAKLSAPKSSSKLTSDSGKSLGNPGLGDSSEFELSLDADSDDFDLQLNTDSSDEVDLGSLPKSSGGSKVRAGESGILTRNPNDSGPSLENRKQGQPAGPESDSDDFELSLDPGPRSSPKPAPKSSPKIPVTSDSDSEFELTLDDSGGSSSLEHAALGEEGESDKGDIFETDFEIPPMSDESGSEAVALESDTDVEQSEFDLALSEGDVVAEEETGSEVVALDDEGAPLVTDDAGDVDLADVEVEGEESSVSGAMRKAKPKVEVEDEEEVATGPAVALKPAPWGVFPVLFLFPAFAVALLGGLIAYETLHTMWGYQQPKKPTAPLVRGVADTFEMKLEGQ